MTFEVLSGYTVCLQVLDCFVNRSETSALFRSGRGFRGALDPTRLRCLLNCAASSSPHLAAVCPRGAERTQKHHKDRTKTPFGLLLIELFRFD
ncbi:hypothetical protein L596_002643 [Steinernema carpocapsae]|uniref:Uncharacterized protein n=1 Tax=Steinernema carpocapsae TaxID=34508 RepID=A0A4U8UQ48_STECR|nr:hypothetical protein L596_002643 [Steinernema carpocapsae]